RMQGRDAELGEGRERVGVAVDDGDLVIPRVGEQAGDRLADVAGTEEGDFHRDIIGGRSSMPFSRRTMVSMPRTCAGSAPYSAISSRWSSRNRRPAAASAVVVASMQNASPPYP